MTLGASLALVSAASAQVNITTADGANGADATLFNDSNKGPTGTAGAAGSMELRNYQSVRMRMPIIRFDISALDAASDNSGATISLSQEWGANRSRDWLVYGLRDGFDDSGTDANKTESWDELTTNYNNAPGTAAAGLGTYALDVYDSSGNPGGAWELLHTETAWGINGIGGGPASMPTADLQSFIDADTDGKVTFLLVTSGTGDSSQYYGIYSKEKSGITTDNFPTLVLPNATYADSDTDGLPDFWETDNFGDLSQGAAGDPDSDGSDNAAEYAGGSDPNNGLSVPGDIDGDGLDDTWETTNFGDIISQDGTGDPDSDGLTNEEEETGGSDPNDYQSFVDTDSDGQNDAWEITYFTDLVTDNDSAGDPDSDGYTNAEEYAGMTDPTDAGSLPGDSDADGVPDLWEDQYYGNNDGIVDPSDLTGTDGTPDPDSDGFTDAQESLDAPVASNPFDAASVPGDADADALDDSWEILYFGDITSNDGDDDPDLDLYTNEEEETNGTDPTDEFDFVDTDSDGQNDAWEILYFGDLTTSEDPFDDTDSDGDVNEDEYLFGSDPTDPASTINDIDGDGLDDAWEQTYYAGTVLWNRSDWVLSDFDGSDDMDGDGATNEEEETAGTSPIDAADAPDSDSDGLGDAWELAHFGDLTTSENGADDNDSDGEDNATEFANLTDPTDALSTSDSDNDGLPDGWETNFLGDLTSGRNDDPDSDGDDNLTELRLGTDPSSAGSVTNPDVVSTANVLGGDIDLTNDGQNAGTGPTVQLGSSNGMQLRHWETVRLRIPMVRFDLNNVTGDTSGALLSVPTTFEVNNDPLNTVNVFALVDGSDNEDWNEGSTSYSTAPGIIDGEELTQSVWSRNPSEVRYVGSIQLAPTGNSLSDTASLDLDSLIAADTDGLITLFFTTRSTGDWWGIRTQEEALDTVSLVFPNGVTVDPAADSDSDGLADQWEADNFGDLAQLGTDDPDSDGQDNETEETFGTDPNDAGSFTADTDLDGLEDAWEIANFGDLSQSGTDDPDSDGFDNEAEETAGTDPNDGAFTPDDTDGDGLPDAWEIANFGGAGGPTAQTNSASVSYLGGSVASHTFPGFDLMGGNCVAVILTFETVAGIGDYSMTFDGESLIQGPVAIDTGAGAQTSAVFYLLNPASSVGDLVISVPPFDRFAATAVAIENVDSLGVNDTDGNTDGNTDLSVSYTGDSGDFLLVGSMDNGFSAAGPAPIISGDNTPLTEYITVEGNTNPEGGTGHWGGAIGSTGSFTNTIEVADNSSRNSAVAQTFVSTGGIDPLSYDGTDDPDSDGFDNAAEFAAGTDPTDPGDFPGGGSNLGVSAVSFDASTNTFTMTVTGLVNGQDYHLESSTDLSGFAAVVGSTWTAAAATEVRMVTADEAVTPTIFFRASDGAEP